VYTLAARWSDISFALKLPLLQEESVRSETQGVSSARCLRMVLNKWLQRSYKYDKFGPPTWKMLVKAVGDSFGGNDCALAETIARKHAGMDILICTHKMILGIFFFLILVMRRIKIAEAFCEKHQAQMPTTQPFGEYLRYAEKTTAETAQCEEAPFVSDEEWNPPAEFAEMLITITELLNNTANMKRLKQFLKFFCHPRTQKCYIDIKLYEHCSTPGEIIEVLHPQYINFMHTPLLKQIVNKFGDEQSQALLKQYEDNFPRKKPLKHMRDPLTFEETENCPGSKRMKILHAGDTTFNTTTIADVEDVRQTISRNTGIDERVIVYANQTPGSVIFTFLIPETVVSAISDLGEDGQRNLAAHDILMIEVNEVVIDLQSWQAMLKTDTSQAETKTDTSTYTTSGMKRVPLTHDSLEASHCKSEFQQLIIEVETAFAKSVEASELKKFLQSFNHILYPQAQYIDLSILKDVESVPQIFTALQSQIINFLNWGIVLKAADAFGIEMTSIFQLYQNRFPSHTQLSMLPDPLSENEISDFRRFQKLRVTCSGGGTIKWTLGDVKAVKKVLETATGIDQDFIIYAYWEGGFTTHQFTFLIPKSISGIFGELCDTDLAVLAKIGVQRIEVDCNTVANNIQEHCNELPKALAAVGEDNRTRTKNFGLQNFIPEAVAEQMSEQEFDHLNNLITNTPVGKLQKICSNDFLKVFAKKVGTWKDLAPYLGINQWHLEDLAERYPGDEEEQKYVALITWKSIDVNSATYERLVECLLTHGHINDAKELLLHFQGK